MPRLLLAAVLVIAAVVAGTGRGGAATGSLVANGDAEQGAGSTDGSAVQVPGWTTTGGFTVVQYGAPGFPAAVHPGQGRNFFAAGGGGQSPSSATQTIDLSGARQAIDASRIDARVTALIRRPRGASAAISVNTRDAGGRILTRRTVGPRTSGGSFEQVEDVLPVPPGARSATLTLKAGASDVYFDNLSVTLTHLALPRPQRGKTVLVKPARGVVILFRRGNRKPIARPTMVPLGTVVDTSHGAASVVAATDRYGDQTEQGSFSDGTFSIGQVGGHTNISLGGHGPRTCTQPRRLVNRATSGFMVLAGAMGSRAAAPLEGGSGKAVWVAVDSCTAATVKTHSGQVDVVALGSRRASGRRALFSFAHGRFRTRGRNSSATVRGRIVAR
jgi:hypothetical protein